MPRMNAATGGSPGGMFFTTFDVEEGNADRLLAQLENALSPEMLGVFLGGPVVQHFQEKFDDFFRQEGSTSGPWQPLTEFTIADREAQGFGPGPINQRTGELRDFITDSSGQVRVLSTLAVLTYPGPTPKGELGQKVKTAQQGKKSTGRDVPARPVMEVDETDMLFMMSALSFFIETTVE